MDIKRVIKSENIETVIASNLTSGWLVQGAYYLTSKQRGSGSKVLTSFPQKSAMVSSNPMLDKVRRILFLWRKRGHAKFSQIVVRACACNGFLGRALKVETRPTFSI